MVHLTAQKLQLLCRMQENRMPTLQTNEDNKMKIPLWNGNQNILCGSKDIHYNYPLASYPHIASMLL